MSIIFPFVCGRCHHHHQERTPLWGMAVRMRPLQTVRSCARLQTEKKPMLAVFRSASTVRVHVCAGLPLRLFQSRGWPWTAEYRIRRLSNSRLARETCLSLLSLLERMISDRGRQAASAAANLSVCHTTAVIDACYKRGGQKTQDLMRIWPSYGESVQTRKNHDIKLSSKAMKRNWN